jgi:sec-independent protein translocase protein TatB
MLDFSFGELALIVLVALVIVGPKDMPVVMRTIGRWVGQFRGITDEFRAGFKSAMNETSLKDIEKDLAHIQEEIQFIKDEQGNMQRTYDISDFMEERTAIQVLPGDLIPAETKKP